MELGVVDFSLLCVYRADDMVKVRVACGEFASFAGPPVDNIPSALQATRESAFVTCAESTRGMPLNLRMPGKLDILYHSAHEFLLRRLVLRKGS
jgi:hypothetical protein